MELGINYFDTAELYGFGDAEVILGQALKDAGVKREEVVISTKLFWGAGLPCDRPVADHFAYYT